MNASANETKRPLRADDFQPLIGREARFGDSGFALVLAEVECRQKARGASPRAPFSLIFSGAKGDGTLADGIYACAFDGGPTLDIHLTPVHTPAADRQDYEAVFT